MKYSSIEIPQANSVDLLFHAIAAARFGTCSATDVALALSENSGTKYVERQGAYYADACVILGLMVKNDDGYILSQRGKNLAIRLNSPEAQTLMADAILSTPLIQELLEDLSANSAMQPTVEQVAHWVSRHTDLSFTTANRRASTLRNYLAYAWGHQ